MPSFSIGRSPAKVALAWVARRPGVSSVLIGASRVDQLAQNVSPSRCLSLEIVLEDDHLQRLEKSTALRVLNPYCIFQIPTEMVFGGQQVRGWNVN
nr:aldo/keto reductase [Agrobacterium rubi]